MSLMVESPNGLYPSRLCRILSDSLPHLINFSIISALGRLSCLGKGVAFCAQIQCITWCILTSFYGRKEEVEKIAERAIPFLSTFACFLRYRSLSSLVLIFICCPPTSYRDLKYFYYDVKECVSMICKRTRSRGGGINRYLSFFTVSKPPVGTRSRR